VSGVRNSWLILLKNSVLATSSSESLACVLRSSRRARLELVTSFQDLALHLPCLPAQLVAKLACAHELSQVLDSMEDVPHFT
jgi:hypothetical protein